MIFFKKRVHFFELMDQDWFPHKIRVFQTDLLHYQLTQLKIYQPVIPLLKRAINETNFEQIIDLCSGSSGPIIQIQETLEKQHNIQISAILSDKYPSLETYQFIEALSNPQLKYLLLSVDATSVPSEYKGFRTLFTAFHHFREETARAILQDAVNQKVPIGIFEFTERTWGNIFKVLTIGILSVFLQTPLIKPFTWQRCFWTYIIPIVPLAYTWDALVSHLRSYSVSELQALVDQVDNNDYFWDIGQVKSGIFNITYLIGFNHQND